MISLSTSVPPAWPVVAYSMMNANCIRVIKYSVSWEHGYKKKELLGNGYTLNFVLEYHSLVKQ